MTPFDAPTATAAVSAEALRELDRPEPAEVEETASVAPAAEPARRVGSRVLRAQEASTRSGLYASMERLYDKVEAFVSRLSVRDNFWNSICSLIWLPLAFFSGIRLKAVNATAKAFDSAAAAASGAVNSAKDAVAANKFTAAAVLPFRRFNRNWYRAMAGGALLANSEIAGGMYVFGLCGGDYTVVCKNLNYTFLRPCFGPAVYRMVPREDIKQHLQRGGEFNITLDLDISQQGFKGDRDRRVGRCEVTFHVTPKQHHKDRRARRNRP